MALTVKGHYTYLSPSSMLTKLGLTIRTSLSSNFFPLTILIGRSCDCELYSSESSSWYGSSSVDDSLICVLLVSLATIITSLPLSAADVTVTVGEDVEVPEGGFNGVELSIGGKRTGGCVVTTVTCVTFPEEEDKFISSCKSVVIVTVDLFNLGSGCTASNRVEPIN
jgi:hypothetical protein